MVNQRSTHYLENNKIIPNIQCGLRRNRSAADYLTRLSDSIYKAINNKKVVAIFIDLIIIISLLITAKSISSLCWLQVNNIISHNTMQQYN